MKSKVNKGSNFMVAFPTTVGQEVTAIANAGEDVSGTDVLAGKSYLLLDDIPENTFILSQALAKYRIRTTACQSGIDALALYTKVPSKFDGIITDLRMPIMSGQSFIKSVRRFELDHRPGRRVPILVITAESALDEKRLCLTQYGANDFLLKPVKLRELVSALVRLHSASTQPETRRVLIVDDDMVGARFLSAVLAKAGCVCTHAFSLGEGIGLLKSAEFDVVTLDNFLGDGTGADFIQQAKKVIKTSPGKGGVKVISVSGNAVEEQRAMYRGEELVVGFLQKPVKKQDLLGLVQVV